MTNKGLSIAKYLLALATNTITDDIRAKYLTTIDISDNSDIYKLFKDIVSSVFSSINSNSMYYTIETGIKVLKTEYEIVGLNSLIGDFSQYEELFTKIAILKCDKSNKINLINNLTVYKDLIDIVDRSESKIAKNGIYFAVLNFLVKKCLVTKDLTFSKKVIAYVDEMEKISDLDKIFYDIVSPIL